MIESAAASHWKVAQMVTRRNFLVGGSAAGLSGLMPTTAQGAEFKSGRVPENALPEGIDTNPESYDWVAVYKSFVSSLAGENAPLPLVTHTTGAISPMGGPKGEAAKLAIKGAIKALSHIGKKSWDKAVSKLPLPGAVKKYLGYEAVMKALNIAVNFEGTVEDSITDALKKTGVRGWAAGIVARAIVTILL